MALQASSLRPASGEVIASVRGWQFPVATNDLFLVAVNKNAILVQRLPSCWASPNQ